MAIINTMKSRIRAFRDWGRVCILLAPLAVSACGFAQWPPPGDGPRLAHRPSDDAFINATAVTVGKDDTVYAIARRHKVSPRDIIQINRLAPPYRLEIGQRLKLPGGRIHTVAKGESLSIIGNKYGETAYAVARINSIKAPYTIYPGQKLRIPRSGQSPRSGAVQTAEATNRNHTASTSARAKKVQPTLAPPTMAGKGFLWPVNGRVISAYGPKAKGLQNDGINIVAPRGTPVRAAENGVVAYAGNELRTFGNLLLIKHSGGWMTAYAHNDILLVKRGDKVSKGQDIARLGSSGSVSTPQLHFEMRKGRHAVDPQKYLKDKQA